MLLLHINHELPYHDVSSMDWRLVNNTYSAEQNLAPFDVRNRIRTVSTTFGKFETPLTQWPLLKLLDLSFENEV